jgi:hypothetical protein
MKTFVATLKSTSPISFGRYYAQDVPKKDKESAADYEERTWHNRLHVAEDGRVFIPPFAFKNCLDSAAKYLGMQIPGKRKNTFTKHFVSGVLVMDPLVLPLKGTAVGGEWRYVPADGMPGGSKRVMKCFPVRLTMPTKARALLESRSGSLAPPPQRHAVDCARAAPHRAINASVPWICGIDDVEDIERIHAEFDRYAFADGEGLHQ